MPDAYLGVSGDASVGIGTEGLRVGVSGLWSRIDPRDILLDVIDYKGSLVSAQLYGFYPIIRSREENLSIGASFSLDNDNSTILTTDFVDDRLRSVSVWGRYDFVDQTRAVTSLRGALTHGVDLFGATGNSRANGVVKYTKVELDAQRNQPLADVLGGALSLQATAHAQAALGSGALFSAPECSFGGRRFGRGFDSGILTGDHCAMGSVELHWVRSVDFPDLGAPVFLDFYAFVDGGVVWQKGEVLSGEPGRGHAASLGLGLSVQFTAEASGLLEVSRPVSLSVGTPDETRILGALSFRF
ncbi:ShlB/FhaC/HecB family hemolysin secretion/activation protein [Sinorhizobium medicae]|nr:ShlB/FhaC/HecB family hemolysin secretion/activation protein [Sinorhizobium medicae]